jgi:hypothetical protein
MARGRDGETPSSRRCARPSWRRIRSALRDLDRVDPAAGRNLHSAS